MLKNIKLVMSPFTPTLEVVDGVVFQIRNHSLQSAELEIGGEIVDFNANMDKPGIMVRNFSTTVHNSETRLLTFDLKTNSSQVAEVEGRQYQIQLLHIGKEKHDGHDFYAYEFQVERLEAADPDASPDEGTFFTTIFAKPNWEDDKNNYRFPVAATHGLRLETAKTADGRLHVSITGPMGKAFKFAEQLPAARGQDGNMLVLLRWKRPLIELFANNEKLAEQRLNAS